MASESWNGEERLVKAISNVAVSKRPISGTRVKAAAKEAQLLFRDYKRVVHTIEKQLKRSKPSHRLGIVYLIDFLCKSKSKAPGSKGSPSGPAFTARFGQRMLSETLPRIQEVPLSDRDAVEHVVQSWQQRGMFGFSNDNTEFSGNSAIRHREPRVSPEKKTALPRVITDLPKPQPPRLPSFATDSWAASAISGISSPSANILDQVDAISDHDIQVAKQDKVVHTFPLPPPPPPADNYDDLLNSDYSPTPREDFNFEVPSHREENLKDGSIDYSPSPRGTPSPPSVSQSFNSIPDTIPPLPKESAFDSSIYASTNYIGHSNSSSGYGMLQHGNVHLATTSSTTNSNQRLTSNPPPPPPLPHTFLSNTNIHPSVPSQPLHFVTSSALHTQMYGGNPVPIGTYGVPIHSNAPTQQNYAASGAHWGAQLHPMHHVESGTQGFPQLPPLPPQHQPSFQSESAPPPRPPHYTHILSTVEIDKEIKSGSTSGEGRPRARNSRWGKTSHNEVPDSIRHVKICDTEGAEELKENSTKLHPPPPPPHTVPSSFAWNTSDDNARLSPPRPPVIPPAVVAANVLKKITDGNCSDGSLEPDDEEMEMDDMVEPKRQKTE